MYENFILLHKFKFCVLSFIADMYQHVYGEQSFAHFFMSLLKWAHRD
jgi:hypothetical protein